MGHGQLSNTGTVDHAMPTTVCRCGTIESRHAKSPTPTSDAAWRSRRALMKRRRWGIADEGNRVPSLGGSSRLLCSFNENTSLSRGIGLRGGEQKEPAGNGDRQGGDASVPRRGITPAQTHLRSRPELQIRLRSDSDSFERDSRHTRGMV